MKSLNVDYLIEYGTWSCFKVELNLGNFVQLSFRAVPSVSIYSSPSGRFRKCYGPLTYNLATAGLMF